MSPVVATGRQLSLFFLVLCLALSVISVVRYLLTMTKVGVFFAVASGVFIFFVGAAAWQIFQWNPTGRYIGFIVVLNWFGALVSTRNIGTLAYIFSVPMAAFGIWLSLPQVKQEFQRRKAVA